MSDNDVVGVMDLVVNLPSVQDGGAVVDRDVC